jgi:hypothetical protein
MDAHKSQRGGSQKKWIGAAIATVLVLLITMGDELVGGLYFRSLCAEDSGPRVYKQVGLPSELWTAEGQPVFLDSRGNKIRSSLDQLYRFNSEATPVAPAFHILRKVESISDRQSGERIATYTSFFYFGGWLRRFTSLHVVGTHCPAHAGHFGEFLQQVFVRR